MSGGEKFIAGLLAGAAAGAAAVLFLQTEKGKEWVEKVKEAADDAQENAKSKFEKLEEEFSALVNKGKQFVQDLETKSKTGEEM